MRISNELGLDAINLATASSTGPAILIANCVALSVHAVSTGDGIGVVKIQVSNDSIKDVPTNWSDLASATIAVTAASSLVLPKIDVCYQFMRLVYTKTSGTGSLSARVKTIGF